jgi:DNA invertase Pin-like site-specific DNA recombinase
MRKMLQKGRFKVLENRSRFVFLVSSSSAGRFFFHVMASLAQMERELILERTRAGPRFDMS